MGILVGDVLEGFVAVVDEVVVAWGEIFDIACLVLAVASVEDDVDGIEINVKALGPPCDSVACGACLGHLCARPVAIENVVLAISVNP